MNTLLDAAKAVLDSFDKRDINDDGRVVIRMFELSSKIEALRKAVADADGMVLVPISTLNHWRELVDLNPKDLAPRIDEYIGGSYD